MSEIPKRTGEKIKIVKVKTESNDIKMPNILLDTEGLPMVKVAASSTIATFLSIWSSIQFPLWSVVIAGILNVFIGLAVAVYASQEMFSFRKITEGVLYIVICFALIFIGTVVDSLNYIADFKFCNWISIVLLIMTGLNILKNAGKVFPAFSIFTRLITKKVSKTFDVDENELNELTKTKDNIK